MPKKLTIIATNAAGQTAALHVDTDAQWLALSLSNANKMEGFTPVKLERFCLDEPSVGGHALCYVPTAPKRTVLAGKPVAENSNDLEEYALPGLIQTVLGKRGTIQLERDVVAHGQALRDRYWRVRDGEPDQLIYERCQPYYGQTF